MRSEEKKKPKRMRENRVDATKSIAGLKIIIFDFLFAIFIYFSYFISFSFKIKEKKKLNEQQEKKN